MILDKTKSTKVLHKTPANISEQLQIWAMVEEPGSKSVLEPSLLQPVRGEEDHLVTQVNTFALDHIRTLASFK